MDKNKARRILSIIKEMLLSKNYTISLDLRGKLAGYTDCCETILLNPFEDLLPSLVHECLHCMYPKKGEDEITVMEVSIISLMSTAQFKDLLHCLAFAVNHSRNTEDVKELLKESKNG